MGIQSSSEQVADHLEASGGEAYADYRNRIIRNGIDGGMLWVGA